MLDLPERARVNRRIPKTKFYEKLDINSRLKEMFVDQVETITWTHKLAPATINLAPTAAVEEIQIFAIRLKTRNISSQVLESIDKAIPYPIVYLLHYEREVRIAIAYKRNQRDENKSVIKAYYFSDWIQGEELMLPIKGTNLEAVYENIIRRLLPVNAPAEELLDAALERYAIISRLEKECARLETRIKNEKQFDRKVELNMELQQLRKELAALQELRT